MAVNFSEKISGRMSKKDSKSAKNGKEPQKAGNGAGAEKSILPPALKGIGVGLGVTCVIFAVCALVLQAVWKLARKGVVDAPTGVILIVTFVAVAFLGISPVIMVVIAAAAGILLGLIRRRRV